MTTNTTPIVLNPRDAICQYDAPKAWLFQFGEGIGKPVELIYFGNSIEAGLEECGEWLLEHAPGFIVAHTEEWEPDALDADGDPIDHTYTESGWIASWEWWAGEHTDQSEALTLAIRQLHREGELGAYFDRGDILAAWNLWLQENHGGQFSPEYERLCKLGRVFKPSRSEEFVWGLGENALAIYANLLCQD